MSGARVELLTTSGVFALDGGEWEVDNNVWLVGDDEEVVVVDAAHDADAILAAVGGRRVVAVVCTHAHNDHVNAAPAVAEPRVGVQEVGGAVQGDDGLPRARPAVDDQGAAGPGADDGVLIGLDGAEHVPHPGRPVVAQAGDEGGLVVEGGVPLEPVGGEHLVPVVADPAAGPPVPAAAGQPHRVGVGGREERFGRRGA
ncbi:MBL fold metallo-hydrolase, partial [Nocardiopsis tropica]|nr:MBL fold metallo-hydrolase [Nocardiopsis tropica]